MIARAPQPHQFSSGALALLVHVGFFTLLIFGVNWRAAEPPGMVVDLWSDVPAQPTRIAPPPPPPEPAPKPEPVKKVEPKPAPPTPIQKTDIALKDKKPVADKPKLEPAKPIKQEQPKQDLLRQEQLKQEQAQATLAQLTQARQNAAQQSVVNDYSERIRAKMRGKLNKDVCGAGNPELIFDIRLLPTGEISGTPTLRKSSGIPACDKAVFDAIKLSEPLPVPAQPDIFNLFRDLHLSFKPNA